MDLSYGEEYEQFRTEVRAFLKDVWPPKGDEAELSKEDGARRFRVRATEKGYLSRGIPRKYGGSEQPSDEIRANIIREEFSRAHAPMDAKRGKSGRRRSSSRRPSTANSIGARVTASPVPGATWHRSRRRVNSSVTSGC